MKNNISLLKNGYTIIEILVAITIMSLLLLMTTPIFTYSKSSVRMMKELDIFHDARKANYEIASDLKLATRILYPPAKLINTNKSVNQLIYSNSLHQVIVVFVNDKNELMRINYDTIRNNKISKFKKISGKVIELCVKYPNSNLIEFTISYLLPTGKSYKISNLVSFVNSL